MAENNNEFDTNTSTGDETNLVKHLRDTIKAKDSELAEIRKIAEDAKSKEMEAFKVTEEKVKRLEFENHMTSKYPQMQEQKEDVWKTINEKQGLSYDEAVALNLGQVVLQTPVTPTPSPSFGSSVGIQPQGTKTLSALSDEELMVLAKREAEGLM